MTPKKWLIHINSDAEAPTIELRRFDSDGCSVVHDSVELANDEIIKYEFYKNNLGRWQTNRYHQVIEQYKDKFSRKYHIDYDNFN